MSICYLDYVRKSEEAEARHRRGERQLYCGTCGGKWVWLDECDHEGRMTIKQFDAYAEKMAQAVAKAYPSEQARSSAAYRKAKREGKL